MIIETETTTRSTFPAETMNNRRVPILGTNVSASTFDRACQTLAGAVRHRIPMYVSCANVYAIMLAHDEARYQKVLNGASYVTADGMPIVWALRALGFEAERVHNDDLFLSCCRQFPEWRHFLVGGREGQPERVAEEMERRFPGIEVVGTHATPVRPLPPGETERILERMRMSQPSIVWVGMGTPAQDYWMSSVVERVGVPMVGIGSLFDMMIGRTRPAPQWVKRAGLQWLFRWGQEPRRLAFRYLYYNPRFVAALAGQLLRGTLRRSS